MEEKSKKEKFPPAGLAGNTENASEHFPEDTHAPETVVSQQSTVTSHKQPASADSRRPKPMASDEASADKPETENMEVHHHSHPDSHRREKKNWKAYFWEIVSNIPDSIIIRVNTSGLNEQLNFTMQEKAYARQETSQFKALQQRAERLMDLIKKEYHLE